MSTLEAPTEAPSMESAPSDNGGFVESLDSIFSAMENPQAEAEQTEAPQAEVEQVKTDKATGPLDDIDFEDNAKEWTPQAARRFKELKSELKTYKTRAEELEQDVTHKSSRLQELEALANNPENQILQDRLNEYESQMIVTKLEQSQAYKSLVEQPLMALVNEADAIATKYEVDGNSLLDIIAMDDESAQEEQLAELLSAASDRDKFRIYKIIEEVKPILNQRQALQENAQAALQEAEALDAEESQYKLVQKVKQREEAASAVADKLRSKIAFLTSMEGVDLNNIAKEAAQIDPATLDNVNSTYQAIAAKLLPKMAGQYMALQKEVDALTSRLADYDRSSPKAGGGSLNSSSGQTSVDSNKSFVDAVAAAFGG
jgi:hypothetical protein